jgi:hypothetical protein
MPRDAVTIERPTLQARAQYGLRVMERAVGVLGARVEGTLTVHGTSTGRR